MKRSFSNTILGALVCHLLAACATHSSRVPTEDQIRDHLREKKSVSILFIGNSLSFGLPKELERITRKNGVEVRATLQAHNGWNLARHSADAVTLEVLRGSPWDIVVLQEQSRIPSQAIKRRMDMLPAVEFLAREARAVGALPVLYQTWGYRDGDKQKIRDDFFAMNQRLRDGYQVAARAEKMPVVRVGDAWEIEMKKDWGRRLFMSDGLHPSRDGVRLNARVFYETLFSQAAPKNRKMRLNAAKPTRGGG